MTSQSQTSGDAKSAATGAEPSAAFTPGPWSVAATDDTLVLRGREKIATAAMKRTQDEEAANARLIAAAPDLYEAAKTVLAGLDARIDAAIANEDSVPVFAGIAALHDAIAKAEAQL